MGIEIDEVAAGVQLTVVSKIARVGPLDIPGIVTGAAYTANDQMGSVLRLAVPKAGIIRDAFFYDLSDQALNKTLWVFRANPVLAADNAAFALDDVDIVNAEGVMLFSTWRDGVNGQLGITTNVPLYYTAPSGYLFLAVQTAGTDTIAAGNVPKLSLLIEEQLLGT